MRIHHEIYMSRDRGVPRDGSVGGIASYGRYADAAETIMLDPTVTDPYGVQGVGGGSLAEGERLVLPGRTVYVAPWESKTPVYHQPPWAGQLRRTRPNIFSTSYDPQQTAPPPSIDTSPGLLEDPENVTPIDPTDVAAPYVDTGIVSAATPPLGGSPAMTLKVLKTPALVLIALRDSLPGWVRLAALGYGFATLQEPGGLWDYLKASGVALPAVPAVAGYGYGPRWRR